MIQLKKYINKKITIIIIIILYYLIISTISMISNLYQSNICKKILEYDNDDIYSSSEIAELIDLVLKIKHDKQSKLISRRPIIFFTKYGVRESYIEDEKLKNLQQDIISGKNTYIIVSMDSFVNSKNSPFGPSVGILKLAEIEIKEIAE